MLKYLLRCPEIQFFLLIKMPIIIDLCFIHCAYPRIGKKRRSGNATKIKTVKKCVQYARDRAHCKKKNEIEVKVTNEKYITTNTYDVYVCIICTSY